ncbi:hypothetical protein ACVW1A_007174 [Bradyrhizobium sp. LB1.3]
MSNVLTFPGKLPASNVRMLNVTAEAYTPCSSGRQRASRNRNPLRHPCHSVSIAVTVAGKIHRGEALRADPYLDEGALLWKGVEAARLLLAELFELAVTQGGRAQQ